MTFIDYTPFYYRSIVNAPIPPLVTGKFVQLWNGGTQYLVLSPRELSKYHANIVERFCMDKGIEGSYDAKRETFTIADRSWEILGGGKFERDENNKAIKLYDTSMAYGKFDGNGLTDVLNGLPELSGYSVTII